MGDRPPPKESEFFRRYKHLSLQSREAPKTPIYLEIYEEAMLKKHWIYDPEIKRWQSPEEFLELEKRISGGEPNRLSRLQVKDPIEGIEASYIQLQDLKERMEIFIKRVVAYYKR